MLKWFSVALAAAALAGPGRAQDFDYYVMALSWSPTWCLSEGDASAEQCAPERDLGFVLHGLWPQFEEGWPEYCATNARDPSRRESAKMADVMGSGGLAWYEWKKHGRCSGLEPEDYFALSRAAFRGVVTPRLGGSNVGVTALRAAFLAMNPGMPEDGLAITCDDGMLDEVRICLDRRLHPRSCGADVLTGQCRSRATIEVPEAP